MGVKKQKLMEEMFVLQENLNLKIDNNWYENRSRSDLIRAIWAECAELMGSLPWKWWATPSLKNVHIEIVDIWHFALSYILLESNGSKAALDNKLNEFFIKGLKWKQNKSYLPHHEFKYLKTEKIKDKEELKRKITSVIEDLQLV